MATSAGQDRALASARESEVDERLRMGGIGQTSFEWRSNGRRAAFRRWPVGAGVHDDSVEQSQRALTDRAASRETATGALG